MEVNKAILEGMVLEGVFSKIVDKAKKYNDKKMEQLRAKSNANTFKFPGQKETEAKKAKFKKFMDKNKDVFKKIIDEITPIINKELAKVKLYNDRVSASEVYNMHCNPKSGLYSESAYNEIFIWMDYPWADGSEYDEWYDDGRAKTFENSFSDFSDRIEDNKTIKKYGECEVHETGEGFYITVTINKELLDYSNDS